MDSYQLIQFWVIEYEIVIYILRKFEMKKNDDDSPDINEED